MTNSTYQQEIIALLRSLDADIGERTPFCPDEYTVAAYLAENREMPDRRGYEQHLAGCSYCLALTAALGRLAESAAPEEVSDHVLAEAREAGRPPARKLVNASWGWAAAAIVVLAFVTVLGGGFRGDGVPDAALDAGRAESEQMREMRGLRTRQTGPRIIAPTNGSSIPPEAYTVRWKAVPGSLYYDIRIVDESGFLLWKDRVEQTHSALPDSLELASGTLYFVRVDAYLAEARSISSEHVQFTVQGKEN